MAITPQIEPEDFEQIVLNHQKQIYRILLCHVRDEDAADTLTQECFLRAYQKRGSFRGDSSLSTWLIRIAINLARDHQRNRRLAFWRRLSKDPPDQIAAVYSGPSPEKALQDREMLRLILSEVEHLPARQKTVFLLHFIEEMPLETIAETMDLRLGTVKSHLFRALALVRKACAPYPDTALLPGCRPDADGSQGTILKEDII